MAFRKLTVFLILLLFNETFQQNYNGYEDFEVPEPPCRKKRPGDPDLTTYDIISSFRFDEFHARNEGVRQIIGSTDFQTAYHLEEYSNMTIESVQAFPKGVPNEFSFECTFRVPQEQPLSEWYLFELTDYRYENQMSVTMNPIYNTIGFTLPAYDGSVQTISFGEAEIFDQAWHKLMFGITQDSVRLWVDCKPVPDLTGRLRPPLNVRGPIDATGGAFSIAQDCRTKSTVPIDVQWMIFSCDAEKPARTNCQDLALSPFRLHEIEEHIYPTQSPLPTPTKQPFEHTFEISTSTWKTPISHLDFEHSTSHRPWLLSSTPRIATLTQPEDLQAQVCPEQCPAGPPGIPGEPGPIGPPGLRGLDGLPGLPGLKGEPGVVVQGERGEPGERGLPGLPGVTKIIREIITTPSDKEIDSTTTEKQPSIISNSGQLDERGIQEICLVVVKEYLAEIAGSLIGPPGPRGPVGKRGAPGVQGIQGEQGLRGQSGERGFPGLPGHKGPAGDLGPPGPEGQKGDRGADGYGREGPQGPEGPPGPEGRSRDGRNGRNGEPGPPGQQGNQGDRGPPGQPGVCDCSQVAQAAQYAYPLLLAQQQYNNKGPQAYNQKG